MDFAEIKKSLDELGYVVIPNVITRDEKNEYLYEFNKWMDSIPDMDAIHRKISFNGIFKHHEVGHQRFAWLLRTNPKIQNIFKSLWNTEELVVSFDGCCWYPSGYNAIDTYWLHSDQAPNNSELSCYQSFLSLTPNRDRTIVVYEGSHKLHKEHSELYNLRHNKNWNPIEEEYAKKLADKRRVLKVDKGSLVIWDSRTFHQNTTGGLYCEEERLVQYLCFLPRDHIKNTTVTRELRKSAFQNLYTTTHHPYEFTCVPLQPVTYNRIYNDSFTIDYDTIQPPKLDDLMADIIKII
jgi:hypothetical protein